MLSDTASFHSEVSTAADHSEDGSVHKEKSKRFNLGALFRKKPILLPPPDAVSVEDDDVLTPMRVRSISEGTGTTSTTLGTREWQEKEQRLHEKGRLLFGKFYPD